MTLLLGSERYHRAPRSATRRGEVQNVLVERAAECLPGLLCFAPDLTKPSQDVDLSIDVLIVDMSSRRWWPCFVVSVVVSFDEDVLSQINGFRSTPLLSHEIDALCSAAQVEFRADLRVILDQEEPVPLAILGAPRPEWHVACHASGGGLLVFEHFHSASGDRLLRMNGDLPVAAGSALGPCKRLDDGMFRIEFDLGPDVTEDTGLFLHDHEGITACDYKPIAGGAVVVINQDRRLPDEADLTLYRLSDNRFAIRSADVADGQVA
jgi:hypothetical protein